MPWKNLFDYHFPFDTCNFTFRILQIDTERKYKQRVWNLKLIINVCINGTAVTPHLSLRSRVLGCEENLCFERWNSRPHPPI